MSEPVRSPRPNFWHREPPREGIDLSLVLVDWSCRESAHILDYLERQTLPRERIEILWIELYDRRWSAVAERIAAARAAGRVSQVDLHASLGLPQNVYWHKHLAYNAGLLLARGRIVCICDADAMVRPTFAAAIVAEFDRRPNIVLHCDEVRNRDRGFYPFCYPDFDEATGPGCDAWVNGRPLGLCDPVDPLHARNYGACFAALRADLLAAGGADMHPDYAGHICGPYEMTFRLARAGKQEVWHPDEWLYHVWHPGEAGTQSFSGPHDGAQVSSRALQARATGRVEPWVEHPAVALRRELGRELTDEELLARLVDPAWLQDWRLDRLQAAAAKEATPPLAPVPPFGFRLEWHRRLRLAPLFARRVLKGLSLKRDARRMSPLPVAAPANRGEFSSRVRTAKSAAAFVRRHAARQRHWFARSWLNLCWLARRGDREIALYGRGEAAETLLSLARFLPLRVAGACPFDPEAPDHAGTTPLWDERRLAAFAGPIVIASFVNSQAWLARLLARGIPRERVAILE